MPHYRDVQAFHDRAPDYEVGWRGRMHRDIVVRSSEVALRADASPRRVLDIGCGTGLLLRFLADRLPGSVGFVGVDAAAGMIEAAQGGSEKASLSYSIAKAERLPFPDASFDLVVSTNSFDHWEDQRAGLSECSRVLSRRGHLVLTDQFSLCMIPTMLGSRGEKARTKRRASRLLEAAGFRELRWHRLYALIIGTAVVTK